MIANILSTFGSQFVLQMFPSTSKIDELCNKVVSHLQNRAAMISENQISMSTVYELPEMAKGPISR